LAQKHWYYNVRTSARYFSRGVVKWNSALERNYTLKDLDRPVYDPYREDKEFIRIRNELEADLF